MEKPKKYAHIEGENFEVLLEYFASRSGWDVEKIPMGARIVYARGKPVTVAVKTPFDFIFCKEGKVIFVDSKKTDGKTFAHSKIKSHQLESLLLKEKHGVKAGYIVHFKALNQVIFFSAGLLSSISARESLKPENGLLIGGGGLITLDLIYM